MFEIVKTEDFQQYNYSRPFSSVDELIKMQSEIDDIVNLKHKDDILDLEIHDNSIDESAFYGDEINSVDLTKISQSLDKDSDNFQLTVTINKRNLSVYSLKCFLESLDELKFNYILNNFNSFTNTIPESLYIAESNLCTKSSLCRDVVNRERYISLMGNSVNAFGFPSHKLIPDDFNFNFPENNESNSDVEILINFIEKLKGLLSLFYLSDFIELKQNNISIKINNTFTSRLNVDFQIFSFSSTKTIDVLFEIYQWVYNNENNEHVQDKLELAKIQIAKNMIISNDCLDLKDHNIVSNLNSMYKIYLKENVDKYIEATNKVAEIVAEMNYRQNEITASFTNSLKTNSTLLIGFFISLVVYNNLSAGELSIFNNSNFILVVMFTIISAITLGLSVFQVNRNISRSSDYFIKQKEIFQHLFSPDDINELFSDDHLNDMEENVKYERNLYTAVWIIELIIIFFAALIATYFPDSPRHIYESIIKIIC